MKEDKNTIWGFDLDNLEKFKDYLERMKETCLQQRQQNEDELDKIDFKYSTNIEEEENRIEKIATLNKENQQLSRFLD